MTTSTTSPWSNLPPHPYNPALRAFHTTKQGDNVPVEIDGKELTLLGVMWDTNWGEWVITTYEGDETTPLENVMWPEYYPLDGDEYELIEVIDRPPHLWVEHFQEGVVKVRTLLQRGVELYVEIGGGRVVPLDDCTPHLR